MFCCLFGMSGSAESCSGFQNQCVGLLAEEEKGREKLEGMAEYRLSCRQCEQCISLFHIQNLISLSSKSSLLHLLDGVKLHLLPISEQVRSLWETDSCRAFLLWGQLICVAGRVVSGGLCHPAWIVGLRHTLCTCHCIMVLFIQGSNPPQSVIMHSLLSSQKVITSLWGWVMCTG